MSRLITSIPEMAHGFVSAARDRWARAHWRREDRRQLQEVDLPEISDAEFQEMRATWPFLRFDRNDLYWARLYKKVYGFDPHFLGSVNQFYELRALVNPYRQICSLENKALADCYLPEIPFPEVYVRGLNGRLFDRDNRPLDLGCALDMLKEKKSFVIKPGLDSMCGRGVHRIDLSGYPQADVDWLADLFKGASREFIVQEVVLQQSAIARLNPTSLNCSRITSVYVGGEYTCAALQKIGKAGSPIDNWNSAYFVGIQPDGFLKETGWDDRLHASKATDNGIPFKQVEVPGLQTMLAAAETFHKRYFPQCGIVGWDMVIDAAGQLKVIEANLTVPGLPSEQLCSGPFLRDVREELCQLFQQ